MIPQKQSDKKQLIVAYILFILNRFPQDIQSVIGRADGVHRQRIPAAAIHDCGKIICHMSYGSVSSL